MIKGSKLAAKVLGINELARLNEWSEEPSHYSDEVTHTTFLRLATETELEKLGEPYSLVIKVRVDGEEVFLKWDNGYWTESF